MIRELAKIALSAIMLSGALYFAGAVGAADTPSAVTYWIELVRDGQTSHVTQKATFKTGDKIKFHIKPNIDGYAYVALKSGALGDSAVLFPLPHSNDDNHVAKGVDIAIPSDDFMEFDKDPGTEHVCLTLSRDPIDPKSLLSDSMRPEDTRVVMKAKSGSKDLVPVKIKVTYSQAPESPPMSEATRAEKLKKYAPAGISYHAAAKSDSHPATPESADSAGEVTVTQSEAGGALNIDVDLSHTG